MKKVRIHEIAKKLGISSKKLVEEVKDLGVEIKSYMSTVDEDTATLILEMFEQQKEKGIPGKLYKEKKSGRVIDHKPRMKSSISVNRGFCTHCGNTIKKSNADDRFCNKCYDKLFPK